MRCLAPVMAGHGGEARDLARRALAGVGRRRRAGDLARLEGARRTFVVGCSMGALVACALAHDQPERVDGLVLLAPALELQLHGRLGGAARPAPAARGASIVPKAAGSDVRDPEMRARNPSMPTASRSRRSPSSARSARTSIGRSRASPRRRSSSRARTITRSRSPGRGGSRARIGSGPAELVVLERELAPRRHRRRARSLRRTRRPRFLSGLPVPGARAAAGQGARTRGEGRPAERRAERRHEAARTGAAPAREVSMASYVMAIDQGTTGTTVLILDRRLARAGRGEPGVPADLPEAGLGGARPRRHLGPSSATRCSGRSREAGLARRATSPRSASPTSARRRRSGTASSGRPLHHAIVWQDRRTDRRCARAQGRRARAARAREDRARARSRTSRRRSSRGSSTTCAGARDAGRGRASSRSGPSTASSSGGSPAARAHVTDVIEREPHAAHGPPHARVGPRAARAVRRAARACCRRSRPSSEVYGTTQGVTALPDGIPVAGHRGRSAGGALRAGLLRARARRSAPTARARSCSRTSGPSRSPRRAGCSPPSRGSVGRRGRPTRSRAAPSSRAPRCSGCATGSAHQAARRTSRRSRSR